MSGLSTWGKLGPFKELDGEVLALWVREGDRRQRAAQGVEKNDLDRRKFGEPDFSGVSIPDLFLQHGAHIDPFL